MKRLTDPKTAETVRANLNKLRAAGQGTSILDEMYVRLADYENADEIEWGHIVYIGRKSYAAENTIKDFMIRLDIIADAARRLEYFFEKNEKILDLPFIDPEEAKYFIDRIKAESKYE